MEKITDIVIKQKIEVIVFLGDLVGVNEKNIRDRQLLMRFIMSTNMLQTSGVYTDMILIRPIELYRSQPVTTLRWHFRNIYGY
jgi:hypothetical protein